MTSMSLRLRRIQTGYTVGARALASGAVRSFADSRVTPNQLTAFGTALNVAAAVLIYREVWIVAAAVFLVGSIVDVLDGALARSRGLDSPLGAVIDSVSDRASEGFVLGAIALVLARDGVGWALAAVFVALVCSFLTSYARARAEALGFDGKGGLAGRAERVTVIAATLALAPWGALPWGIVFLAAVSALTVAQRLFSIYRNIAASSR